MAATKKKAPAAEKQPAKQSGNAHLFVIFGMILLGLMIFAASALMLFLVGCIPAMVAYIIDREPDRNATLTVAAANVAGVAPFIFELLLNGPTMDRALTMLTDVFVIVVMFGTAGVGWLLVLSMPKVAAVYIEVMNEAKIKQMRREQKRLVEEWGDEVTASPGA